MQDTSATRVPELFFSFLRFGLFTFGGGWSIVAQMQKRFVEEKQWLTDEDLLDLTSIGRSLPGIMICNTSTLFGHHIAGVPGALAALIGIVIPPFLVMIGVTTIYDLFRENTAVSWAMMGVRAAVVPIILSALLRLLRAGIKDAFCAGLAILAFFLCLFSGLSNVLIILIGAALGLLVMEVKTR